MVKSLLLTVVLGRLLGAELIYQKARHWWCGVNINTHDRMADLHHLKIWKRVVNIFPAHPTRLSDSLLLISKKPTCPVGSSYPWYPWPRSPSGSDWVPTSHPALPAGDQATGRGSVRSGGPSLPSLSLSMRIGLFLLNSTNLNWISLPLCPGSPHQSNWVKLNFSKVCHTTSTVKVKV